MGRLALLALPLVAIVSGCGQAMCGGLSLDFNAQPGGRLVAVGPPRPTTPLFVALASPPISVGAVTRILLEQTPDLPDRSQCLVMRAPGKTTVFWYCQDLVPNDAATFDGMDEISLPGGRAAANPCWHQVIWNVGTVGYEVIGDPVSYSRDDVIAIARTLAAQVVDGNARKMGWLITSLAQLPG